MKHKDDEHANYRCQVCNEQVSVNNREAHENSHKEKTGFARTLEDVGKIKKDCQKGEIYRFKGRIQCFLC